ncbi:Uncharacterized protein conserved in bacteria [Slackia heliotrinireducens]|uniref:Acyltransferase 3 domain-containing protein n=1 Tax=Slackia heliotrinireducens (strain ATCC 29202 / DSM 20476 / NCTC 11029 / RHS 1) TaxID=471855 RepID=C7N6E4_SLAHD|nr:acyltransferase [Slackia heliotrinireducens]ACV22479.1 hypothetical protein Shel_14590 [Slackia heliotrinireducens DSM 20476]VEH00874.1 Uncharacterized protein conserved in bacteria [Slackia heliotrinireducens]
MDESRFDLNIISKYRAPLYGISIFWIMLFHGYAKDLVDYSFGQSWLQWFYEFIKVGNVGVDIFLFLSGVCLYFSFVKNHDHYAFIKKRLARVYIPVIAVFFIWWFFKSIIQHSGGWTYLLSRLSLMHFWLTYDASVWFVSLIIILYFAYPYIHDFLFAKGANPEIRCVILVLGALLMNHILGRIWPGFFDGTEIALTRIPVFIIGCWFGKYVYEKKTLPYKNLWIALAVIAAVAFIYICFLGVLHGVVRRYFYTVGGIAWAYVWSLAFAGLDQLRGGKGASYLGRFMGWLGGFSLELYVSHIMLNQVYRSFGFYNEGWLPGYLVVVALAILLAFAAYKLTDPFIKRISGKPRAA